MLNIPITGASEDSVASSRIDRVGGLSIRYILEMPPAFCAARVGSRPNIAASAIAPAERKHSVPYNSGKLTVEYNLDDHKLVT